MTLFPSRTQYAFNKGALNLALLFSLVFIVFNSQANEPLILKASPPQAVFTPIIMTINCEFKMQAQWPYKAILQCKPKALSAAKK